ncbi:OrdA [Purpureocillium lavendulum]|uniref:OrdA n=1 Tax=Purpureocillium lavendulum TaxID=1247861 RepID=A0AB34FSM5_9HYPO|nr:OrdA [Purpureocillium lavendulum]
MGSTGHYIVIIILVVVLIRICRRRKGNFPPGPRPFPLVGNIRDLPTTGEAEYLHWLRHKETYGPLSSVVVLGQPLVIIHDRKAAEDLLERTSLKTSGRPRQPFAAQCGFNEMLPGLQYDVKSKRHRKFMHQQLGTKTAAQRFSRIQDVESERLLLRILSEPQNLINHYKKETSAVILKITYGYAMEPHSDDPLVELIEQMMSNFSSCFVPLSWAVDIIPQLRHLPEGFPGAGFKRTAREWYGVTRKAEDAPFRFVQDLMAAGIKRPSYVSSLIERLGSGSPGKELNRDDEDTIKHSAAILHGGAADTTLSTLASFTLAMLLYPEVQRKAQREIDDVVGPVKLPTFEDRSRLPYINAVVKECLRWFPVVPIGTTHATTEEIIYNGFCIPKGSYLLPSLWWFLHDPDCYAEPSVFAPERFLSPRDEPDPSKYAFGFGRRICPGRFLAQETLFITIARILATFHISKAMGDDGRDLEVKVLPTPGLLSRPAPFSYRIEARSKEHEALIRTMEENHVWDESDAGLVKF